MKMRAKKHHKAPPKNALSTVILGLNAARMLEKEKRLPRLLSPKIHKHKF